MLVIEYYSKNVYGRTLWYYAEDTLPEIKALQHLTQTKTLDEGIANDLKTLGFTLELVLNPKIQLVSKSL